MAGAGIPVAFVSTPAPSAGYDPLGLVFVGPAGPGPLVPGHLYYREPNVGPVHDLVLGSPPLWHYAPDATGTTLAPDPATGPAASDFVAPLPAQSTEGAGARLMFDVSKAAVRAGQVSAAQWDDANRGANSVAFGLNSTASGASATVAGGSGNAASAASAAVGGGSGNSASAANATVAGGGGNSASAANATVAGGSGGAASSANATVAGGSGNTASGPSAAVGGGTLNSATATGATVAGGLFNAAGLNATVGGGLLNAASGPFSTVGGGTAGVAGGQNSTVPGGRNNRANGDNSFVCGATVGAVVNDDGAHPNCFVWGDSGGMPVSSYLGPPAAAADSVWFGGGASTAPGSPVFTIFSTPARVAAAAPGVQLVRGGAAWVAVSDVNAKENLRLLDGRDVLDRVDALPVYEFNYKGNPADVVCRGPTAQDWHRLFPSNKPRHGIDTMDLDGIALAAIKGLARRSAEQAAALEARLAAQDALLAALAARLAALEAAPGTL